MSKVYSFCDGNVFEYEVSNGDFEGRYCLVSFTQNDFVKAQCLWRHFEEMRWFCSHVLRVFNIHKVVSIPLEYIVARWRKNT